MTGGVLVRPVCLMKALIFSGEGYLLSLIYVPKYSFNKLTSSTDQPKNDKHIRCVEFS